MRLSNLYVYRRNFLGFNLGGNIFDASIYTYCIRLVPRTSSSCLSVHTAFYSAYPSCPFVNTVSIPCKSSAYPFVKYRIHVYDNFVCKYRRVIIVKSIFSFCYYFMYCYPLYICLFSLKYIFVFFYFKSFVLISILSSPLR